jgi:hypothetical protein
MADGNENEPVVAAPQQQPVVPATPNPAQAAHSVSHAQLALPHNEEGAPTSPADDEPDDPEAEQEEEEERRQQPPQLRPPPQRWGTRAERDAGTARVKANDPDVVKICWPGRFGEERVMEYEVVDLARALRANTHVQQLEIRYSRRAVTAAAMGEVLSTLRANSVMISVHLGDAPTMTTQQQQQQEKLCVACTANLCRRLGANDPRVVSVDWSGGRHGLSLGDAELGAVARALPRNRHLRRIELGGHPELTDGGLEELLAVLPSCALERCVRAACMCVLIPVLIGRPALA